MELYLSMAAFALASSITPGPVNLVALNCGARFGLRASGRHIAGATLGFTLLLLLIGLGLYELLERARYCCAAFSGAVWPFCSTWPGAWPPMTDDCNLRVPQVAPRFCRVR